VKNIRVILNALLPIILLLFTCKSPVSNDNSVTTKAYYIANEGSDLWFTETNAQEVVIIENDIITFYYKFAPDSVCFEGGKMAGWCEIKNLTDKIILIESGDTSIVKPWPKGNPPWPTLKHIPDC
jgi:hypothetical protein